MACIIEAIELFSLKRGLNSSSYVTSGMARHILRDISLTHRDMVVANVAAMLAKPPVSSATDHGSFTL